MHLLIDAGNTRIKWALLNPNQHESMVTQYVDKKRIEQSLSELPIENIESVWLSSVRDAGELENLLNKHFAVEIHKAVSTDRYKELISGYLRPEQLGVDRWLALCSCYERYNNSFIVIDAGTAITLDVVDKGCRHLGGHIIPGRDLMVESLNLNTHLIEVKDSALIYELDLGADTQSAVTNGASSAVTGYIGSVIEQYPGYKVVITGGAACEISASLKCETEVVENLVLEGLSLLI